MRIKKIKDSMYKRDIYFAFNCSQQKVLEWIKKVFQTDCSPSTGAVGRFVVLENKEKGHMAQIVWVEKFSHTPSSIAVVAHEVLHLTFSVLDDLGLKYDSETSEEAFTYYFDHLLEEFIKTCSVVKRSNKRGKRKRK